MRSSVEQTDKESSAVAVARRISLADIENAIGAVYYATGERALSDEALSPEHFETLSRLTICIMVMRNGYMVIGKHAPVSKENRNVSLGRKFAYEDCIRQLWPVMAFSLLDERAKT